MTKSQRVAPVTAEELRAVFEIAGLTVEWFCEATGADNRRVRRWLSGAEPEVPLWAATFALALCTAEAQASVRTWLAKYRERRAPQPAQSVPLSAESAAPFYIEPLGRDGRWYRLSETHRTESAARVRAIDVSDDIAYAEKRTVQVRVKDRADRVVCVV